MFSERDRAKCQALYAKYYAGRKFHDALYRDMIRRHLRPGSRLLDAGCGRYLRFCREFAAVADVVGIDLESTFDTDNRVPPFAIRGDVGALPFPSECFDMVISRSVVEHLADPPQVFREFYRVLRPGGRVVIITPNKYDYVSLIAAVTPYRLHRFLVSRIFRVPAYLMFSPMLFRLGVLYERLTSLPMLESLRGSILCVFEKPAGEQRPAGASMVRHGERAGVS
jgi:SAM-dependent methyltransferase